MFTLIFVYLLVDISSKIYSLPLKSLGEHNYLHTLQSILVKLIENPRFVNLPKHYHLISWPTSTHVLHRITILSCILTCLTIFGILPVRL